MNNFYEIFCKNRYTGLLYLRTVEDNPYVLFPIGIAQNLGLSETSLPFRGNRIQFNGRSLLVYSAVEVKSPMEAMWLYFFRAESIESKKDLNSLKDKSHSARRLLPRGWKPKTDGLVRYESVDGSTTTWNIEDIKEFKKMGL